MKWKREIKGFVDGLHEMKWSVVIAPLPLIGFIALLIALQSFELFLKTAHYLVLVYLVLSFIMIVEAKNL